MSTGGAQEPEAVLGDAVSATLTVPVDESGTESNCGVQVSTGEAFAAIPFPTGTLSGAEEGVREGKRKRTQSAIVIAANEDKKNASPSSGIKGIYAIGNRWKAEIKVNGKKTYLGSFTSIEEASAAVDRYKETGERTLSAPKDNPTGHPGVYAIGNKWKAQKSRKVYLGLHDTPESAAAALERYDASGEGNLARKKSTSSGVKGVYFFRNQWKAQGPGQHYLGLFATVEEASAAVKRYIKKTQRDVAKGVIPLVVKRKGVYQIGKKWKAQGAGQKYLGLFDTQEEAAATVESYEALLPHKDKNYIGVKPKGKKWEASTLNKNNKKVNLGTHNSPAASVAAIIKYHENNINGTGSGTVGKSSASASSSSSSSSSDNTNAHYDGSFSALTAAAAATSDKKTTATDKTAAEKEEMSLQWTAPTDTQEF